MTVSATERRRDSLAPALAAAAALHVGVFALALWAGRSNSVPAGAAVPITLVAHGPTTDSRPAEAAPVTQTAQTEDPVPQAKPATPPPAPAPKPAPPAPKAPPVPPPKPAPAPKPLPDKPTQKPAPAAKPAPDAFNLDALAARIARTSRPTPPRPASGIRGPARAETAPVARVDAGQGVSESDIAGLSQLLERLWNPNCIAAENAGVVIPVKFSVGDDGRVKGAITEGGRDAASDKVVATAARRAIDAVHQAEPYGAVYRGKSFTVNFDAKTACANR